MFLKKLIKRKRVPLVIPEYIPHSIKIPSKLLDVTTAWKGLESIIEDIMQQFNVKNNRCLEFGVEFGYSTVALSNFFKEVRGVDLFIGDKHTVHKGDHFQDTKQRLSAYSNIELFKANYKSYIKKDKTQYDLIHVDIVHTYKDTYKCGLWSARRSTCTIFHDTESFRDVKQAVIDIAKVTGKKAYNYPHCNGLGIIV